MIDGLTGAEDSAGLWTALTAIVMVCGLAGVIVPVLPGLALIWAVALVYGLMVGFGTTGWVVMVVLSVILAISVAKGVVIPKRTSEASGASGWSQLGAGVGAIAGFFLIPVVGVVVGALVGILAVEFALKQSWSEAWAATIGMAKGFGLSALIDLGLGLVMIATWSIWAYAVLSG